MFGCESNEPSPTEGETGTEGILVSDGENCSEIGLSGIYAPGEPLGAEHHVTIHVEVTQKGNYEFSTNQVNGYRFRATGQFTDLGEQKVVLMATGIPEKSQTDQFTIDFGASSCGFEVPVKQDQDHSNRIIVASGETFRTEVYQLYAFDENQNILWTRKNSSTMAIADGIVYMTTLEGVAAVDIVTGEDIWYRSGLDVGGLAALADGVLYTVGYYDGSLYALDITDGSTRWVYKSESYSSISSLPTVAEGMVYIGGNDGYLWALNKDGSLEWKYKHDSVTDYNYIIRSSPAFAQGILYVGSDDGFLYALDAEEGHFLWRYDIGIEGEASPTIDNGKLYIQGGDKLFCFDASDGTLVWDYVAPNGNAGWSTPVVEDGIVYANDLGSGLQAFDANSGEELWSYATSTGATDHSPTVFDGTVYITGVNGISTVDALTGELIWNYGKFSATNVSVEFYTPAVVYDKTTHAVGYPAISGNRQ